MSRDQAIERTIDKASREYYEDGLVSVTTFIQLTNLGCDAEAITNQIEAGEI